MGGCIAARASSARPASPSGSSRCCETTASTTRATDGVVDKARGAFDAGDCDGVTEVANHVVFADPDHARARDLLADPTSRSATARSTAPGAASTCPARPRCARAGSAPRPSPRPPDTLAHLCPEMHFDALAIQVDGPEAWDQKLSIDIALIDIARTDIARTDIDDQYRPRCPTAYSPTAPPRSRTTRT